MNDHIAKPVNPEQLYATLLRWLPLQKSIGLAARAPTKNAEPLPPLSERLRHIAGFNIDKALAHSGGDLALLELLLKSFIDTYRHGEPALLQIANDEEHARCARACHSVRGACAAIGALQFEQQLAAFENLLKTTSDGAVLMPHARALQTALLALVDGFIGVLEV